MVRGWRPPKKTQISAEVPSKQQREELRLRMPRPKRSTRRRRKRTRSRKTRSLSEPGNLSYLSRTLDKYTWIASCCFCPSTLHQEAATVTEQPQQLGYLGMFCLLVPCTIKGLHWFLVGQFGFIHRWVLLILESPWGRYKGCVVDSPGFLWVNTNGTILG